MNQELKSRLNEGQYEAVTTLDGPVLVIAGGGAGKQGVIEYRAGTLWKKVSSWFDPSAHLHETKPPAKWISRAP